MTQLKLYGFRGIIIERFRVGESVHVVGLETIKIIHILDLVIDKRDADRMRVAGGNIKDDSEEVVKDGNSLLTCLDHGANRGR